MPIVYVPAKSWKTPAGTPGNPWDERMLSESACKEFERAYPGQLSRTKPKGA